MTDIQPHRKLVAILAADVVGYSRMVRRDEDWAVTETAARFDSVLKPEIAGHNGRVFKTIGDGLLAEFASVVDAVNCAAAIQRSMADLNAALPEENRVVLRIGVNLGDVVVRDGDLHGDGVNLAARLESLAEPGGVLISSGTFEQVRDKIDLPFEDLGLAKAKNIDRPLHVYALADDSAEFIDLEDDGERRSGFRFAAPLGAAVALGIAMFVLWSVLPDGQPTEDAPPLRTAVVDPEATEAEPETNSGQLEGSDAALPIDEGEGDEASSDISDTEEPEEPEVTEPFEPLLPLPNEPSLAVLPFGATIDEGSAQAGNEQTAVALSDYLFNELSRVPGIFLSAPASARTAAGSKSPADAAEILGVRHVLTGTAVNTDNALQVTASLIDVQENTTLWEDTFDGRPEDLFVIGGTVAHDVAAAMGLPVDDARSDDIGQVPDAPYAVWERYANARATTDREQALDKLAPVLESAPEFAAAEGLRARLLAEQALSGEADDPSALLDAATNHAEAALALDENNTDARMALALIQLALGALEDAIKNHQKTLEMQPNNVEAQGHLGIALTYAGRYDEAVKQLQGAVRRDPENSKSPYRAMLGLARFAQGDYEEAAAIWEGGHRHARSDSRPDTVPDRGIRRFTGRG